MIDSQAPRQRSGLLRVSVVGFDDVPEAGFYIPPLTTIRQDFDAVAAASIDLLLAQITSGQRRGKRRIIAPGLVSRESVGPPPRSRRRKALTVVC
jgi:DNA-binding LacI/PurR family transcriptional regulator